MACSGFIDQVKSLLKGLFEVMYLGTEAAAIGFAVYRGSTVHKVRLASVAY